MKFQLRSAARLLALGSIASCGASGSARAEVTASFDTVQVTATRDAMPIIDVPASISVVTGDSLRARGANDLRTAFAVAAGVEGTAGGDGGPAGSVPALWGLREADAFLLVVDGVPWGGAFNPATPSLDLTGVERIEILRGAAPVSFGATSFVGVIHIIHYRAGQAPAAATFGGGSHASYGASLLANLPTFGGYQQSLTANVEKRGSAEDRTQFSRFHALYRGAREMGSANFHIDADISILPQDPSGNLLLRDGRRIHNEFSVDTNFNPKGAKLDQRRFNVVAGLDGKSDRSTWASTLALTRTLDTNLRGFLRGDAFANAAGAAGDGFQADGYSQMRGITDVYFDAHATRRSTANLQLTYGLDYSYGRGTQHANNFGYCVANNGVERPCAGARHADEITRFDDTRHFGGLYSQFAWQLSPSVDLLAGLRLNHTRESSYGQAIDNTGPSPDTVFSGNDALSKTRLSGTAGVSWRAWSAGTDALTIYGDWRNSYKPLAIDFGPEAEGKILKPETANSYELGAKLQLLDRRWDVDFSLFKMDFKNGLTFAPGGNGQFVRANGGATRFRGFEIESRFALKRGAQLFAHYAHHDARFVTFTRDNGADASGNRFEMSPRDLSGIGIIYSQPTGANASLVANFVGARMLNKSNTVEAGSYTTVDASVGYQFRNYRVQLNGYNLTNRRDPVTESELQEVVSATATAGYYRLPARSLLLTISADL